MVTALLAAGSGSHHHFGHVPDAQQALVRALLAQHGIDPARFVCHGNVASVQGAIAAIDNPVYLPSFPVGGGLTIVEVLSAGVPVLFNAHARPTASYDFIAVSHASLMPDRYAAFAALEEIAPALRRSAPTTTACARQQGALRDASLAHVVPGEPGAPQAGGSVKAAAVSRPGRDRRVRGWRG